MYYQIRNVGLFGKCINAKTCKTLVQSFVISGLDNGNARLYNIPLSDRPPTAARLVTRPRKREHITPVLFHLHFLPVRFRLFDEILFITFKVLNGTASVHLSDLIEKYIPARMLQSESYSLVRVPRSHTVM